MGMFLLLLLALSGTGFAADTPIVTFKSGVSNVPLDVLVLNGTDIVKDLTQQDFVVYDENQQQPILYFNFGTEPLSLLLLLDVSGSMQQYIAEMGSVARAALWHLQKGDRVGVMVFAHNRRARLEFTDNLDKVVDDLKDAVHDDSVGSTTEINNALLDAAKFVKASQSARRSVLILTDNLGLNFKSPDEPVIRSFDDANIVLNAMVVGRAARPELTPGHYLNPDYTPPDVFTIAETTGGEAVKATNTGQVFREMIARIRTRYSMQFKKPEGASGYRRLRVELSPSARLRYPKAVILARKGYWAEP
jgi:VWFA-related protein